MQPKKKLHFFFKWVFTEAKINTNVQEWTMWYTCKNAHVHFYTKGVKESEEWQKKKNERQKVRMKECEKCGENENQPRKKTNTLQTVIEKIRNKTNNNKHVHGFEWYIPKATKLFACHRWFFCLSHQMQTIKCCTAKLNAFYFSHTFSLHGSWIYVCTRLTTMFHCSSYSAFSFLFHHSMVYP